MKAARFNGHSMITPRSQRGVVLLIALIILVAMTLAGIGMMRSVDMGSVIAGNLAFRQSTLNASETGTSTAFNNSLAAVANSSNPLDKPILNFHGDNTQPCPAGAAVTLPGPPVITVCPAANINLPGYFSSPINPCEVTGQTTGNVNGTACTTAWQLTPWWTIPANWANAVTLPPVTDPVNGATIATVSYIIHRMCQLPNAPPNSLASGVSPNVQLCQTYTQPSTGCSKTQVLPCAETSVFYRITTRSVGARSTTTYTQTLVLIGI